LGGIKFALEGGAKLENGAIVGTRGAEANTALCEDTGITEGCIDIKVKLTGATTGGISFKYKTDDRRVFIGFDKRNSAVRITNHTNDGATLVQSIYCKIENDKEIDLRIAFRNSLVKIFVNDISDTAYPLAELTVPSSSGKGLKLDCGNGSLQFLSINVSDYVYQVDPENSYKNPVAAGADPFILTWEGKYYLYSTNSASTGFKVYESDDLSNWKEKGYCLQKGKANSPAGSGGFWAPEVYRIDGRFYMFYVTDENIGVAVSDSPLGPFTKYSDGVVFKGTKAIDPHLFIDDDGQMYLYYVKFGGGNHIYGAKFDLKTCKVTEERHLLSVSETWETLMEKIAEGPFMLKHNGVYYLTYSANHYKSQGYAVGCATSSSPLGNFEKCDYNPILSKNEAIKAVGTGHHSFFTANNGELFIVYHRHFSLTEINSRQTCIDRCGFVTDSDGSDRLVVYGPTSTIQKLPE
ncbi:MAG: family 43 glycosylhydrolase, partial [Clostridia bacterium]|nr:family 43 glycosylhydrolase [Clostridia bacterium]